MNKTIFFLLTASVILFTTACERDPPPLSLDRFDVRWFDDDFSGTQTPGDALEFIISVSSTDNDPNYQYIREWEFSYSVNGAFGGILQGAENENSNTVNFTGEVAIADLFYPGPGQFKPGDAIDFRFWAIDNLGTQIERSHRFVLE